MDSVVWESNPKMDSDAQIPSPRFRSQIPNPEKRSGLSLSNSATIIPAAVSLRCSNSKAATLSRPPKLGVRAIIWGTPVVGSSASMLAAQVRTTHVPLARLRGSAPSCNFSVVAYVQLTCSSEACNMPTRFRTWHV